MDDIKQAKPEVEVILGERSYRTFPSFDTFRIFELLTGLKASKAETWEAPLSVTVTVGILAAAIRSYHDKLSNEQLLSYVSERLDFVPHQSKAYDIVNAVFMKSEGSDDAKKTTPQVNQ